MEDAGVGHDAGLDGIQHNHTPFHPGEIGEEDLLFGCFGEQVFARHVVEQVLDDHS